MTSADTDALPLLREDLAVYPGPSGAGGVPSWTLHDPLGNRFLRIGWLEFEFLQRWRLGSAAAVLAAINAETTLRASAEQLTGFVRFLGAQQLLQLASPAASHAFHERRERERHTLWQWLLHHYLFIRIPLLQPQRLLDAALPWVGGLYRRGWLWLLLALAGGGALLILRHWERFTHEFPFDFTLQGALAAGACIGLSKLLHEFGHAFTAARYGCRVPAMGVALIVFWPVFWTDVTEAWKLRERRPRLAIGSAGVVVELALATLATWAWVLLPDGALRNGAHLLAGSAWLLTLAINLNPFMRFDGYYLLSDLLDEPNLQARAFALGRWRLREWLFQLGEPRPEQLPPARERLLTAWAWGTWIYRLLLFTGIALAVYHLFFKLLGLLLFAVEIGWFIVRPIVSELRAWREHPRLQHWRAWRVPLALLALLGAVLLLPWQTHISAPAVWLAPADSVLYVEQPARLQQRHVQANMQVDAGDVLFSLASPDLEHTIATLSAQRAVLLQALGRRGFDAELNERRSIDWQELLRISTELDGALASRERLTIRAPFAGRIVDLDESLRPGDWLGRGEALATLVAAGSGRIITYVEETDLGRIHLDAPARFYVAGHAGAIAAQVVRIEAGAAARIPELALASIRGGDIATRDDGNGAAQPVEARYRVELQPDAAATRPTPPPGGEIAIAAGREAPWQRLWRQLGGALIRESGW